MPPPAQPRPAASAESTRAGQRPPGTAARRWPTSRLAWQDLTDRFPLIVEALVGLRSRSVILDGEAVACDDSGMSNFDRLRHRHHDASVFLYAFDLIELNGDDTSFLKSMSPSFDR